MTNPTTDLTFIALKNVPHKESVFLVKFKQHLENIRNIVSGIN